MSKGSLYDHDMIKRAKGSNYTPGLPMNQTDDQYLMPDMDNDIQPMSRGPSEGTFSKMNK